MQIQQQLSTAAMRGTLFSEVDNNEPDRLKFIGRTRELRFLAREFRQPLTKPLRIVGPKGIGKTALFLEYLRRAQGGLKALMIRRFDGAPDDVFWEALESIRRSEEHVILTIDNFRPIDTALVTLAQQLLNSRLPYGVVIVGEKVAAEKLDVIMLVLAGLNKPDAHRLLRYLLQKQDIRQTRS